MARGWESKSIEAQQEEAARHRPKPARLTLEDRLRRERRRTLELARTRVLDQLGRASSAAHRQMLTEALHTLEQQLAEV